MPALVRRQEGQVSEAGVDRAAEGVRPTPWRSDRWDDPSHARRLLRRRFAAPRNDTQLRGNCEPHPRHFIVVAPEGGRRNRIARETPFPCDCHAPPSRAGLAMTTREGPWGPPRVFRLRSRAPRWLPRDAL